MANLQLVLDLRLEDNISHQCAMFSSSVQPGIVSLFSSTGSDPLGLFESHTDRALPSDSFICLLDDASSLPLPKPPATLITVAADDGGERAADYALAQTVLHIQSPTLRSTFVRCPPAGWTAGTRGSRRGGDLGLEHAWMHMQVRNVGREWAFEVGLVDRAGREGVVRCSTFQVGDSGYCLSRYTFM